MTTKRVEPRPAPIKTAGRVLLASLLLTAAAPAPQQLRDAERARAASLHAQQDAVARVQAAQSEAGRLASERVAAAARLRGAEAATADAAARVAELSGRRRDAEARLAARSAELAPLLPLAERLSLYPAETLLAVPLPIDDAIRGVIVLRGITRAIEADAAEIRSRQAEIAGFERQIGTEMPRLAAAQAAQAREAAQLDQRIAAAQDSIRSAQDAGADAARNAASEAATADGLRAAIARIEAEQRAAETRARADTAAQTRAHHDAEAAASRQRQEALARPAGPGVGDTATPFGGQGAAQLTAPVAGSVVHSFGEPSDAGPLTGITYQAAPAARVVSPCAGRVVFAAPFRSFGPLVIVDCGGGAHIVLSGLDRLDASVGQRVLAGEPVGVMAAWDPRGSAGRPVLKLELRRDGSPVNPAPFLRAKG